MGYNIGDRLLCKRRLHSFEKTHFIVGNFYEIIRFEENNDGEWVVLISEHSNNCHLKNDELKTFFYSKQEERKLKLKKLC